LKVGHGVGTEWVIKYDGHKRAYDVDVVLGTEALYLRIGIAEYHEIGAGGGSSPVAHEGG